MPMLAPPWPAVNNEAFDDRWEFTDLEFGTEARRRKLDPVLTLA